MVSSSLIMYFEFFDILKSRELKFVKRQSPSGDGPIEASWRELPNGCATGFDAACWLRGHKGHSHDLSRPRVGSTHTVRLVKKTKHHWDLTTVVHWQLLLPPSVSYADHANECIKMSFDQTSHKHTDPATESEIKSKTLVYRPITNIQCSSTFL